MRFNIFCAALLVLVFIPGIVGAEPPKGPLVTVDQVIAMTKAGVADAVILAMIDRDRPVFIIAATQLVHLRKQRVSEPVIVAMLMTPYHWRARTPCSAALAVPAPTSTRGMFFTQPTRGIFFPPPAGGCH